MGGVIELEASDSVADWTFSTDTPVCELRASGRALEASPSLRGKSAVSPPTWLRALINAFIVLYYHYSAYIQRFAVGIDRRGTWLSCNLGTKVRILFGTTLLLIRKNL